MLGSCTATFRNCNISNQMFGIVAQEGAQLKLLECSVQGNLERDIHVGNNPSDMEIVGGSIGSVTYLARDVESVVESGAMQRQDAERAVADIARRKTEAARDARKKARATAGQLVMCHMCGKYEQGEEKFQCCAVCRSMVYCSRECQKQHWKKHKDDCVPYTK